MTLRSLVGPEETMTGRSISTGVVSSNGWVNRQVRHRAVPLKRPARPAAVRSRRTSRWGVTSPQLGQKRLADPIAASVMRAP
jgi:hypothetical protein